MRFTFVILLFLSLGADAQMIIKAYPNYKPLSQKIFNGQASYSVRKLDGWGGSALRVRRSNDNEEQDIGFVGVDLDTATLKTFVGANSGFVTTWFDQSSSGEDAIQSTAANQPRIVNAGVVDRLNGKVCLVFDGLNDNLIADNLATKVTGEDKPFTAIAVASKANTNVTAALLGFGRSTTGVPTLIPIGFVNSNNDFRVQIRDNANGNTVIDGGFYGANSQYLIFSSTTGLSAELFSNNASQLSSAYNRGTLTLNQFCIGAVRRVSNPDFPFNGKIQEVIFFNSDKSSDKATIQTDINTYYGIY
jgi:hypothetical protein